MPSRKNTRKPGGLSDIEARFIQEYLVDLCQWRALRRAEGWSEGDPEKAWRVLACQLMKRPHVAAAKDAALAKQFKRIEATGDRVALELARMALFDPGHLTGVTCPEDIALLPEDLRRAIVGWGWDKNNNFAPKFAKEGALELLGRRFKLFTDKHELTGPNGGPMEMRSAASLTDDQLAAIATKGDRAPA